MGESSSEPAESLADVACRGNPNEARTSAAVLTRPAATSRRPSAIASASLSVTGSSSRGAAASLDAKGSRCCGEDASSFVDVFPVTDTQENHNAPLTVRLVDETVVADAVPPLSLQFARERLDRVASR